MKPFPIYRLNQRVTEKMGLIASLDISQGINDGLDNMIHFVDEQGGPLTTTAEITENSVKFSETDPLRHVTISATYSQFLWMICI
jgi:hypothetical protein